MDFWTRICYYITLLLLACPDYIWGSSDNSGLTDGEDGDDYKVQTYDSAKLHKNKDIRVSHLTTVYIGLSNEQLRLILKNADDRLVMVNFSYLMNNNFSSEAPNEYSWTYLKKLAGDNPRLFVINADVEKCNKYANDFKINKSVLPETVLILEDVIKDRIKGVKKSELETKIRKYYVD